MKKLSMVLVLAVALCMVFAACSAPAAAPAEPAAPVTETAPGPVVESEPESEPAPEVQTAPGPVTGENGLVVFVTKAYYADDNITIEGMMKDVKWVDGEGDETGYYDITDAGETKLIVASDADIMFPDEDEVMAYEVAADLFVQQFAERDYMTDGILFSLLLTDGTVTSMDFLYME